MVLDESGTTAGGNSGPDDDKRPQEDHFSSRTAESIKLSANRRSLMKIIGVGAVGSSALFSKGVGASHNADYDGGEKTLVDEYRDCGEEDYYAEIHSSVNGPKNVDDNRSTINMGLACPVGWKYCDNHVNNFALNDVEVNCELVDSPAPDAGFEFEEIEPYRHGNNDDDLPKWLKYAVDFTWEAMPWDLAAPSPSDLIPDSDNSSVTNNGDEFTIKKSDDTYGVGEPGAEWEVDFDSHNGGTPTGDWNWNLTVEADVGYCSTSQRNPGFNKVDDFYHSHDITVTVEDTD